MRSRGGAALEREAGVDDVAAGQAEVEVAAVLSDRLGDLRDERDDVVVGRLLQSRRCARRRRGRAPRWPRPRRPGTSSRAREDPEDRQLDAEHLLEAASSLQTRARPSPAACSGRSRRRVDRDRAAGPAPIVTRPSRRIVWVRSGPTLTSVIGHAGELLDGVDVRRRPRPAGRPCSRAPDRSSSQPGSSS